MPSRNFSLGLNTERPVAASAEGIYVTDTSGKRYLDASGGATVVTIGHGVKQVAEAIRDQTERLTYVSRIQFTNEPAERLTDWIVEHYPQLPYVWFGSSGSEAVEAAIKIARQYHVERGQDRKSFVGTVNSYHGLTIGALSATGTPFMTAAGGWGTYTLPVQRIPQQICSKCPYELSLPACETACARALATEIGNQPPDSVAAFIGEPMRFEAPPPSYWPMIRKICDDTGALMIVDECASGFWRTGKMFAIEHWNVVPDIICFGKAVTSGYTPLSGILVSKRVFDTIAAGSGVFAHSHAFSANPISSAAALAVQQYAEANGIYAGVAAKGEVLLAGLRQLVAEIPTVTSAGGLGLMTSVTVEVAPGRYPSVMALRAALLAAAMEQRLLITLSTISPTLVRLTITPPYTITEQEIHELVRRLGTAIKSVS